MTGVDLEFHTLEVTDVSPLTDDSVAITLGVPAELADTFRYLPGQHVTLRQTINGQDVRRSYSICSDANQGRLRIGVKQLDGGVFSTYATSRLQPGNTLDVMSPVGEFVITPDPDRASHYCAIAAGSGITPVLSLVATTLAAEPDSRWTVILGNRGAATVMFLDELEGLKNRYPDRLHLIHVLSRETPAVPLLAGRIDAPKLADLFTALVEFSSVDEWFLCGPFEMVKAARQFIESRGVGADLVHDELFFAGPPDASMVVPPPSDAEGTVSLHFTLEDRESQVTMRPETSILDAALAVRRELPYSCKGGMCASCKAHLVSGEVRMDRNWALVAEDLAQGFILTCQSHPLTDSVVVDFDRR